MHKAIAIVLVISALALSVQAIPLYGYGLGFGKVGFAGLGFPAFRGYGLAELGLGARFGYGRFYNPLLLGYGGFGGYYGKGLYY